MEISNRGLNLETELSCSICTEILYQPLTLLDCLHTFCGACLKEWFRFQYTSYQNNPDSHASSTRNPYTCPSCRAPVRATKHDAKVATLLEMFLGANPDKDKTDEEKEEFRLKYFPGDVVLPRVEVRDKSFRERRGGDDDRRLMNEVQAMSLEDLDDSELSSSARRERRRREEARLRVRPDHSGGDDNRDRRSHEGRDRRRRDSDGEGRRRLEPASRTDTEGSRERRRRRSREDAVRRHEETARRASRQVEHQSSLRSLLSSDGGGEAMQEEIYRQIQEEGLLDGIDIENITEDQYEEVRQRIADAYLRRQREQVRGIRTNTDRPSSSRSHTSEPRVSESRGERPQESTRRTHSSRSTSLTSQANEQARPPGRSSASQLDVPSQSNSEGRRRRRASSNAERSTSPRPGGHTRTESGHVRNTAQNASARPPLSSGANTEERGAVSVTRTSSVPLSHSPRYSPSTSTPPSQAIASTIQAEILASDKSLLSVINRRSPPNVSSNPPMSTQDQSTTQSGQFLDAHLVPAPLTPRRTPSSSERANALGSAARPLSSHGPPSPRIHPQRYAEPNITCSRCAKTHIEYELHYNCNVCANGNWNVCLDCYRANDVQSCQHWFGFGKAAWVKWEQQINSGQILPDTESPHLLTANRYLAPRVTDGGAEGRRTLTTENPEERLQSGCFCSGCLAWSNECYWKCDVCNDDDWGFCNDCVNQGKCCTHSLLPLIYKPDRNGSPTSLSHEPATPSFASVLIGPGVTAFGPFKPLTFHVSCDICRYPIQPSSTRYHCFSCTSGAVPDRSAGDYDICVTCYAGLMARKRISPENGTNGWRRCPQGHRMIISGFEDLRGGQRRTVTHDLVGGLGLHEDESMLPEHAGKDIMQWSWAEGRAMRFVTKDVSSTAPRSAPSGMLQPSDQFPPVGGSGMIAVASWSWYPKAGGGDELLFPKGAEVRECVDVNGDWYFGTCMGARGLFPAPYVRVL